MNSYDCPIFACGFVDATKTCEYVYTNVKKRDSESAVQNEMATGG